MTLALVFAWARSVRRDIATTVLGAVMLLAVGAAVPWLGTLSSLLPTEFGVAHMTEPAAKTDKPSEAPLLPSVRLEGDMPDWVELTHDSAGTITVRREGDTLRVEGEQGDRQTVQKALSKARRDEIQIRLERAGSPLGANPELHHEEQEPPPAAMLNLVPAAAPLTLWLFGLLTATSALMTVLPQDRSSGALETLRATRLTPGQIVTAWMQYGLFEAAVAIVIAAVGMGAGSLYFGPPELPATLVLLPLAVIPSIAVGVAALSRARDLRSAGPIVAPLIMALLILMTIAFGLATLGKPWIAMFVPIGALPLVMIGALPLGVLPVVLLVDTATTAFVLRWTTNALERDPVGDDIPNHLRPLWTEAAWLAAVAIAANTWLQGAALVHLKTGQLIALSAALFFAIGVPAIAGPWLLGLPMRTTLSWRAPKPHWWLLGVAMPVFTLPVGTAAHQLYQQVMPPSVVPIEDMLPIFELFASPLGVLLGAIVPGIVEELLFRGALQGMLRRHGSTALAILVQAMFFALFHGHAARLPHTFLLGVLFGVLTWRSGSLWPAMLAHTLHNAISFGMAWMQIELPLQGTNSLLAIGAASGVAATVILAVLPAQVRDPLAPQDRPLTPQVGR